MEFARIHEDGRGGSQTSVARVELQQAPYAAGVPPLFVSAALAAREVVFVQFPADLQYADHHPAPRRQFGVILSGSVETETTDGETRRFAAGDVVLLEDLSGIGHVTRVVEHPVTMMFVPLDEAALLA